MPKIIINDNCFSWAAISILEFQTITVPECCLTKSLPYILFEKYIKMLAPETGTVPIVSTHFRYLSAQSSAWAWLILNTNASRLQRVWSGYDGMEWSIEMMRQAAEHTQLRTPLHTKTYRFTLHTGVSRALVSLLRFRHPPDLRLTAQIYAITYRRAQTSTSRFRDKQQHATRWRRAGDVIAPPRPLICIYGQRPPLTHRNAFCHSWTHSNGSPLLYWIFRRKKMLDQFESFACSVGVGSVTPRHVSIIKNLSALKHLHRPY